ncbi:PilZ domain-containing protein [Anaeromyxobacter paludicola]|uniref:PilZ domain-containing protein n=1 Tax=Anaeromyxobacter paludicola TaxID=2918171 RepID=A0ABM7XAD7_9BACT|nr:PilZ domain-containing protein [Anaeromyxobacter paludicola]BDG08814.1 hypothetical protein AMPC_19270 [Anaeromyxobacter paludicola]
MDLQERSEGVEGLPLGGGPEAEAAPLGPAANDSPSAAPRIRTYEELDGAEGRGVFFRPQRFTAADLAPLRGTVTLALGGRQRVCPVRDVSQSGVAFPWPEGEPVHPGQRVRLSLRFDAHEAFRGEGQVGSVREQDGAQVAGVSFQNFLLDVDELLELRVVRSWSGRAAGGPTPGAPAWRLAGGERFKSLVSELRLHLEDAEEELGRLERELPWHVLHGPEHPARVALVSRLRAGFAAEVVRMTEEIDAALRELPEGHASLAAKEWSLRQVHGFLMQAPCCHRARHKPFGYPGDYEVMNFIYEKNFEGATLFARAVGLAFTSSRAAQAVRFRKDLVKRQLAALLANRGRASPPVRVLSIAAGPAQELFELLEETPELPVPLEVVLFEQDKNALAHAWRRLQARVEARAPGEVRLTFLHDSIKRLLRDGALFEPFGKFDLVYSCGLYDYLAPRTAVVLTRRLAECTAEGGQLLVANMVDHPTRWLMEHHLDWPLIYRTREELLALGRRAVPGARVRLLEEESGANPFFEVVRA